MAKRKITYSKGRSEWNQPLPSVSISKPSEDETRPDHQKRIENLAASTFKKICTLDLPVEAKADQFGEWICMECMELPRQPLLTAQGISCRSHNPTFVVEDSETQRVFERHFEGFFDWCKTCSRPFVKLHGKTQHDHPRMHPCTYSACDGQVHEDGLCDRRPISCDCEDPNGYQTRGYQEEFIQHITECHHPRRSAGLREEDLDYEVKVKVATIANAIPLFFDMLTNNDPHFILETNASGSQVLRPKNNPNHTMSLPWTSELESEPVDAREILEKLVSWICPDVAIECFRYEFGDENLTDGQKHQLNVILRYHILLTLNQDLIDDSKNFRVSYGFGNSVERRRVCGEIRQQQQLQPHLKELAEEIPVFTVENEHRYLQLVEIPSRVVESDSEEEGTQPSGTLTEDLRSKRRRTARRASTKALQSRN